ncbi:hypothetical protein [Nitrosomonas ureae]|uniref:Type I restriction enzyme, S subunit n=1 Tax=Nitrosomonas ureae TaxID=44577 RepID=A0A1H5VNV5_9PROT|nr:hypothetical protein [Nitrosomonas ureae]SEF89015.1 type I restriction enzyme, S subunit [Nitrosomonas ureae]
MSAGTPGFASDKNQDTKTPTSKTTPATPTTTIPPFEKGGPGGIHGGPGGIIPKEPEWIHHLDICTTAETEKKSGRGRSGGNGTSVYGIKKLRELILELAVRGKLVPQDPNDEPAGELLKRIQAEKTRLIAEGKIKKDKPLPPISDEEKLFELPQGWEWTTLALISLINPRNNAEDNSSTSFVSMAMIGAKFNSSHEQEIRFWKEIKQGFTHFAEGDIGVAKITPCFENSKACIFSGLLNGIGAGTTELHIVRVINKTVDANSKLTRKGCLC